MLAKEKAAAALAAIEACCGHCTYCSPDCPVAIARRAMRGRSDDLVAAEEQPERPEERGGGRFQSDFRSRKRAKP